MYIIWSLKCNTKLLKAIYIKQLPVHVSMQKESELHKIYLHLYLACLILYQILTQSAWKCPWVGILDRCYPTAQSEWMHNAHMQFLTNRWYYHNIQTNWQCQESHKMVKLLHKHTSRNYSIHSLTSSHSYSHSGQVNVATATLCIY